MGSSFLFRKSSDATRKPQPDKDAFLAGVVGGNPEWIGIISADAQLMQLNPAGLRMLEADAWRDVDGASMLDFVAPEQQAAWREHHARGCQGETLSWQFDLVGLRGRRRTMETHAVPIALADGSVGELSIIRDITEFANATRALKHANEALKQAVSDRSTELE